jgi:putative redox protein
VTARAQRITFRGSTGDELAGRLDLPAGPPRAHALLAHCFTCGKDVHAASRVAAGLADLGFAVLRFDFTGLGSSEGEFENTHFTSNVGDLVAAAAWLREHHRAPQLLVGHSLGGAAVIAAASELPEVRAVATIGAPSTAEHVLGLLGDAVAAATEAGSAEAVVAGRRFRIRRDLVEDLARHEIPARAAALDAALLLLHSPTDQVVGIEHASALYQAARHPKSFVAIDGADHLLSDRADAEFAATIVSAWAARYVADESGAAAPPRASAPVVVAETTQGAYLNHVVVGRHRFLADEPERIGGFDAGPSPYDLLGAALGACTSMTLRMYAERKGLDLGRITVEVTHERIHADDVGTDLAGAGNGNAAGRIDRFHRRLHVDGPLDPSVADKLVEIAGKCPVHRTLERSSRVETELA